MAFLMKGQAALGPKIRPASGACDSFLFLPGTAISAPLEPNCPHPFGTTSARSP